MPLLFQNQPDVVYFIFGSLIIANVFMLFSDFFAIKGFVKLLKIKREYLFPAIILLCMLGSYGLNNRLFDVVTIFIFGVVGYFMKRWGFKTQPFILGYLVGPMAELYFRRGFMYSEGRVLPFFTSPIALLFYAIAILNIALAFVEVAKKRKKSK